MLKYRNYGFKFHHAEGDIASMLLWLRSYPSRVPPYATHHCGVGAIVINSKNEILVVREHERLVDWKIPGGYVNIGEDFSAAATREIFEETGIQTKFLDMILIRHTHNMQFGCSDVYCICRLEPLTEQIIVDAEIEDAKWIPILEFRKNVKQPLAEKAIDIVLEGKYGLKESILKSVISGMLPYKVYTPYDRSEQ